MTTTAEQSILDDEDLFPSYASLNIQLSGYMEKRGLKSQSFKRRLFALTDEKLYYYKSESDTKPRGVLLLSNKCSVWAEEDENDNDDSSGSSGSNRRRRRRWVFSVVANVSWNVKERAKFTGRKYYFAVPTSAEFRVWTRAIQTRCNNPNNSHNNDNIDNDNGRKNSNSSSNEGYLSTAAIPDLPPRSFRKTVDDGAASASVANDPLAGAPIVSPRELRPLKRGTMAKLGKWQNNRNWKVRLFMLEGKFLYYFTAADDTAPLGVLSLAGKCKVKVDEEKSAERGQAAFKVVSTLSWNIPEKQRFENRTYYFAVDSVEERQEWMDALKEVSHFIGMLPRPTKKLAASAATAAAVAVPPLEHQSSSDVECPRPAFADVQPIKGGMLAKQGHNNTKSWKNRLFLLGEDAYLYYYASERDKQPKGVISLLNCVVKEERAIGEDRHCCCWSIRSPVSWNLSSREKFANRTYYLCVNSFNEMSEWMNLIINTSKWQMQKNQIK